MPPILLILAALGVGGYFVFKTTAKTSKATEASAEATGLFASMLAPSMTNIETLRTAWSYLLTAAQNLAAGSPASSRLGQYALVCFLKACMLAKGAQPDANELAAIGQAPLAGGVGLISYGDAGMDQLQAVAAGLAPTYLDMAGLGQYIAAIANVALPGSAPNTAGAVRKPRLQAYLLALKAKQMLLANPVQFEDAQHLPYGLPQCLFAIANLPASDVPASNVNSILSYQ
jgi:hypothetical protein